MHSTQAQKGLFIRSICKNYVVIYPQFEDLEKVAQERLFSTHKKEQRRAPLLTLKGNIMYDVNYRSRIDTPYAENDIYQHTLQTRLDFVYKSQYPFKVYLTTRFSNSSLFRKYADLTFLYTKSDFERLLKQRITNAVIAYIASQTGELDSLKKLIEQRKASILSLSHPVQKPNLGQKMVEDRERIFFEKEKQKSLPEKSWDLAAVENELAISRKYKFSSGVVKSNNGKSDLEEATAKVDVYRDSLDHYRQRMDTLIAQLEVLEKRVSHVKSLQHSSIRDWQSAIESSKDASELNGKLHQLNMPDSLLPKGYKTLFSMQSFSLGRSMANYSELSVKNTSITGIQVEYNPGYYYAVAAGKVDYRFRDYIVPNQTKSNQYLALVRFGKGIKNGNHIIFTYYTGKRQFFNASVSNQPNAQIPGYNLAGMTIEGLYRISKTTSIVAEIAKSTIPYYSLDSMHKKSWMGTVTKFNDRSNEAFSLRLNSFLPRTQTRLTGNIRYTGANFQSFSTFTTGSSQLRWQMRAEQPFFKKKLSIVSAVQQDDYSNPFVATAYKSSAVLASFQASLRIRKWPALTVGYYPSYQLTKMGENSYSESRYFTMLANASYYYQVHAVQLCTYAVYSKFYNSASDSGFVYFNARNILLSQSAAVGPMSVLLNGSVSLNTGYNIYTMENNDQVTLNKYITVGGGVKMIRHTLFDRLLWGYSGNLNLRIPKLGDIQFMLDKGYMPGYEKKLLDNNIGRLTYYKTF